MQFKHVQGRLESYFSPLTSSKSKINSPKLSLSDLPPNAIRLIFEYSERLTWEEDVDLNLPYDWDKLEDDDSCEMTSDLSYDSLCLAGHKTSSSCYGYKIPNNEERSYNLARANNSPIGLLLLSRSLTNIARVILYQQNNFIISRSGPGGFAPLLNLCGSDIAFLTSLRIELNAPPITGQCRCICVNCYPDCWEGALSATCTDDGCTRCCSRGLRDWRQLCKRLGDHVSPGQLSLFLICEVNRVGLLMRDSKSLTIDVVEPMYQLPQLAQCSIQLSQQKDDPLKDIARKTVHHLVRQTYPPFPFNRLPEELRYQILCSTDLVTQFPLVYRGDPEGSPYNDWRAWGQHTDPLASPEEYELEGCVGCSPDSGTGFASHCKLWHFPIELFLVNRQTYALARHIFFTQNRFVCMVPPHLVAGASEYGKKASATVGASRLIRALAPLPSRNWTLIGNIEIVFRIYEHGYTVGPDWKDFIDTLRFRGYIEVARKICGTLDLSLVFCYLTPRLSASDSETPLPIPDIPHDSVRAIVDPVRRLNKLKSFRVTIFGADKNYELLETTSKQGELVSEKFDAFETELERHVLGETYTSVSGDRKLRRGKWLREMDYKPSHWWT